VGGVLRLAKFYPRVAPVKVVEKDPDDDMFIACALAAEAAYIISGDHHLLDIGEYAGIRIVKVREFPERR